MVMSVDNSVLFSDCPLCHSKAIVKKNTIDYILPIFFANKEIMLTHKPELWKCNKCKSIFTQYIISEKLATELYTQSKDNFRWSQEAIEKVKPKVIINILSKYIQNNFKILDIGCNNGSLLDYAKNKKAKTFGVEYSHASKNILEEKGHRYFPTIENVNNKEFFDVVTAFDVIEHLHDVSYFLKKCYSFLKPGGNLIILTGNIHSISSRLSKHNWWYLKFPEHIIFPSRTYLGKFTVFHHMDSFATYAANDYKKSIFVTLKSFIANTLRSRFIGLPAIGPDHKIYILTK